MRKATTHKLPNKNAYVSPLLWKSKLDSGCDCTLISAGKAYELGLVPDQENSQKVTITGVNGTNTVESITIPQPIYLSSVKDPYRKFALHDVQTISAIPGPFYQVKWSDIKPDLNYLRDVDLPDVNGGRNFHIDRL